MIAAKSVKPALQLAYVKLMMDVIGRGLVMASQVDEEVKQEVAKFPENFTLSMKVFPHGPAFIARVTAGRELELVPDLAAKPDLTITFKHLSHAFLVFSFQESTAQAFANDRMIADGDAAFAKATGLTLDLNGKGLGLRLMELLIAEAKRRGDVHVLVGAIDAAKAGVHAVHIVDGRVPHAMLLEILTDQAYGTMICNQ